MKPIHAFLAAFLLFFGALSARCEPTFWVKDGTPTPVAPKPPQVAPLQDATDAKDQVTPIAIEAPFLAEPSPTPTPEPGRTSKSPTKAALFSALLPGSGQVYTAQPLRGVCVAGVFGVALWQSIANFQKLPGEYKAKNATAGQLFALAAIATYGFGIQDAYDGANRYNRRYHLKASLDPQGRPRLTFAWVF